MDREVLDLALEDLLEWTGVEDCEEDMAVSVFAFGVYSMILEIAA